MLNILFHIIGSYVDMEKQKLRLSAFIICCEQFFDLEKEIVKILCSLSVLFLISLCYYVSKKDLLWTRKSVYLAVIQRYLKIKTLYPRNTKVPPFIILKYIKTIVIRHFSYFGFSRVCIIVCVVAYCVFNHLSFQHREWSRHVLNVNPRVGYSCLTFLSGKYFSHLQSGTSSG